MLAVHWGAEAMLSPEHCEQPQTVLRQHVLWPLVCGPWMGGQAAKGVLLEVEHKNCHPAQCEIVLFRSLIQKYLLSLCFFFLQSAFLGVFENTFQTLQQCLSNHAFISNTLFLTNIQCKRGKYTGYASHFLLGEQMCDRGCGRVLEESKLV